MSSGERPIGAAKGKQSDTEALCQTPPLRVSHDPRAMQCGVPPQDSEAYGMLTTADVGHITQGSGAGRGGFGIMLWLVSLSAAGGANRPIATLLPFRSLSLNEGPSSWCYGPGHPPFGYGGGGGGAPISSSVFFGEGWSEGGGGCKP